MHSLSRVSESDADHWKMPRNDKTSEMPNNFAMPASTRVSTASGGCEATRWRGIWYPLWTVQVHLRLQRDACKHRKFIPRTLVCTGLWGRRLRAGRKGGRYLFRLRCCRRASGLLCHPQSCSPRGWCRNRGFVRVWRWRRRTMECICQWAGLRAGRINPAAVGRRTSLSSLFFALIVSLDKKERSRGDFGGCGGCGGRS